MNRTNLIFGIVAAWAVFWSAGPAAAAGDAAKGERAFRACIACHSLDPGRHLTGPSLAGTWGRKAGTVKGFRRYSKALKSAEVVWTAETLDAWLKAPGAFMPGNRMTFRGIPEQGARDDLIAYLELATAAAAAPRTAPQPRMGDLKAVEPARQVTAIRYCGDTYRVTTGDGEIVPFWEFNLRFKTDSSDRGPPRGHPVLSRAGMMGDRAFVVFSSPEEIATFIRLEC